MVEKALADQIAGLLAPFLPELIATTVACGKKTVDTLTGKVIEAAWNKAVSVWDILWPEVEKEPKVAKAIQDLPNDSRSEDILSWQLENLTISPETLSKIKKIVAENKSDNRVNTNINQNTGNQVSSGNIITSSGNGDIIFGHEVITDKEVDHAIKTGDALIRDQAFKEAAKEFNDIFTKLSPDKFPDKYMRIGNGLGIAYWCLALGGKNAEANLETAIHAYQKTLVIATLDEHPTDYAVIKNNLGNAYNMLSEYQHKSSNLEKAIDAYDECFKVYTSDKYPDDYARVLGQKTNAFQSLFAIRDATIDLESAQRQYYIGYTFLKAAMAHRNPQPAKMAITAFLEALKVYSPNTTPKEYASTSGALGTLYMILSDLEEQNQEANLGKSIQAYQSALLVYDLKRDSCEYGIMQQNLGTAFRMLSEFKDKQNNLKNAIQANQEALKVFYVDQAQAEILKSKIERDQKALSQSH